MLTVLGTVQPKSLTIAAAIANAGMELGLPDMVITTGRNGVHMTGSKHYTDDALDFRTKHLTAPQRAALVGVLRRRLGPAYDVILEDVGGANEHGHCEFDPKTTTGKKALTRSGQSGRSASKTTRRRNR